MLKRHARPELHLTRVGFRRPRSMDECESFRWPRPEHLAQSLMVASRGGQALREQSALLDEPTQEL